MIFSLIFSDLKLGNSRKEMFWHWEYNRITAKIDYCRIYETDYNHVQIWELEKLQIFYLNSVILL